EGDRVVLQAQAVTPLGDDVLDLDVALAAVAVHHERARVELAAGQVGEGLGVQVEHDAPVGGVARTAVTDEERRLLAVVDDVSLGQQRPAGAGGHALLHGLPAGGQARVAGAAGAVVPEIRGRGLALEPDLLVGSGRGVYLGGGGTCSGVYF